MREVKLRRIIVRILIGMGKLLPFQEVAHMLDMLPIGINQFLFQMRFQLSVKKIVQTVTGS